MIKSIAKKTSLDEAKAHMDGLSTIPGLVFACVEPDGECFRCISYWDIDDKALKGQRDIPYYVIANI